MRPCDTCESLVVVGSYGDEWDWAYIKQQGGSGLGACNNGLRGPWTLVDSDCEHYTSIPFRDIIKRVREAARTEQGPA